MAYPVETKYTELGASSTVFVASLPASAPDDVVFVLILQDSPSASSWSSLPAEWVVLSSGLYGGVRHVCAYAIRTEAELSDLEIISSLSDGWHATAITIRDADISGGNPIDSSAFETTTTNTFQSPAFTTLSPDCLLLGFIVEDNNNKTRLSRDEVVTLAVGDGGVVTSIIAYKQLDTAGAAPRFNCKKLRGTGTAATLCVAVKNAVNGGRPIEVYGEPQILADYGSSLSSITPTSINTWLTGTVDGLPIGTGAYTVTSAAAIITGVWEPIQSFASLLTSTISSSAFYGAYHTVSEFDLTGKLLTFLFTYGYASNNFIGEKGIFLVLGDVDGNWAAYRIANKSGFNLNNGTYYRFVLSADASPVSSSATPPDFTRLTRLGYGYHRLPSSSTSAMGFAVTAPEVYAADTIKIYGGNSSKPVNLAEIGDLMEQGGRKYGVVSRFSPGQALNSLPITIGGAGEVTYFKQPVGGSLAVAGFGRTRAVHPSYNKIKINPQPSDFIDLGNAGVSADTGATIELASAASPTATYNFGGASFSGISANWLGNIFCESAVFANTRIIKHQSGGFVRCAFSSAIESPILESNNPGNISNCPFEQGDFGGHAIEITQPGTFSFVGNTFEGYGLDGTTDAAIYNNSGGHVTLNISGGGDTPTVRNGAGATTDVVSGITLTFAGVKVGSEIHIFDSNATLLASVESAVENQTITLQVTGVQVRVFIASLGYENLDIPYMLPASDSTVPVFQRIDRNYRNPI